MGSDAETDIASSWVSLDLSFNLNTGTDGVPETGLIEFILNLFKGHVHEGLAE